MLSNSSQLTKKDSTLRRRKSFGTGAGVKHRLNCLSTLSALQPHSSSTSGRKKRGLSVTMNKPIKTTTKKKHENYVIRLGNQQLMQQFTKTGSSVVVKDDDQDPDLQNLTLQQKIKVFFVLLMIPSAMVVFFGGSKFNNTSSVSIDPNIQLLGAMGGMGGMGGLGGLGGLAGLPGMAGLAGQRGGGYGGEYGGHHGHHRRGYDDDYRRHHSHHDRMSRDYDSQSIQDHLDLLGQRTRNREQNREQKSEPQKSEPQKSTQNNGMPDFNSLNLNEETARKLLDLNSNSDSMKQNIPNNNQNFGNDVKSNENHKQSTESKAEIPIPISESTVPQTHSQNANTVKGSTEPGFKNILMWTPIDVFVVSQAFIDSKCVVNKCIFTSDKSQISQSDAIVFEARHVTIGDLPNMRSSHQKWIFFSPDSFQSYSTENLKPVSNVFNWSWTYRSDSDIVYNYANVKHISVENNQLFKASDIFLIWKQKTKMILWFANSCQTNTKRENYIKELGDYIDVDIYGKCSDVNNNFDIEDNSQLKSLSEKYLFVIVFEKNNCKEFVSKRLFKFLDHNIIPIVMGGADYTKIVPPNSVINAKDFTSAKDLSDYVLDIGSDFQKYKKYFEWKRNQQISYERKDLCQLCYKLHDEDNRPNTNPDIINWWLDSTQCQV